MSFLLGADCQARKSSYKCLSQWGAFILIQSAQLLRLWHAGKAAAPFLLSPRPRHMSLSEPEEIYLSLSSSANYEQFIFIKMPLATQLFILHERRGPAPDDYHWHWGLGTGTDHTGKLFNTKKIIRCLDRFFAQQLVAHCLGRVALIFAVALLLSLLRKTLVRLGCF